jgi:hypothetical protein
LAKGAEGAEVEALYRQQLLAVEVEEALYLFWFALGWHMPKV